jgi:hypothetical protein
MLWKRYYFPYVEVFWKIRVSTERFIFGITKKGERAAGRLIPSKPKSCLKFPKRDKSSQWLLIKSLVFKIRIAHVIRHRSVECYCSCLLVAVKITFSWVDCLIFLVCSHSVYLGSTGIKKRSCILVPIDQCGLYIREKEWRRVVGGINTPIIGLLVFLLCELYGMAGSR